MFWQLLHARDMAACTVAINFFGSNKFLLVAVQKYATREQKKQKAKIIYDARRIKKAIQLFSILKYLLFHFLTDFKVTN